MSKVEMTKRYVHMIWPLLTLFVGALVGMLVARRFAGESANRHGNVEFASESQDREESSLTKVSRSSPNRRSMVSRTSTARERCTHLDNDVQNERREEQATQSVSTLLSRIDLFEKMMPKDTLPEAIVNQTHLYQQGFLEGVSSAAPELMTNLANEIEDRFCQADMKSSHLASLSRLIVQVPELGTDRSLECALERHSSEDFALWLLLDAWRAMGMPPSNAVDRLASAAKDERTHQRLASDQSDPAFAGMLRKRL